MKHFKDGTGWALSFLFVVTLLLTGCADFADTPGKSVWSGGLWLVPWVLALAFIFFAYRTYQAWKSGTKVKQTDKKPTLTSIGYFWFAVIILVFLIAVIIDTIGNR